jgi:hypothetical protein
MECDWSSDVCSSDLTYEIKADQIAGKMIKESLLHDFFK